MANDAKSIVRWSRNVRSKRERFHHDRQLLEWFGNTFATMPCSQFNLRGATAGMMVSKWLSVTVSFSATSTRHTMKVVNVGRQIECRSAGRAQNKPMHGSGEVGRIYNGKSIVAAP
jgi:hypothetical protein